MNDNWINSNLERFTLEDSTMGELTYCESGKIFCKVCDKEIISEDICLPFPSSEYVEGLAHKLCMEREKN